MVRLFSSNDYPNEALRKGETGSVAVELTIAPDGHVSQCAVVNSSRSPSLDATTCRILTERARFEPALDRSGRPTSDRYRQRITWAIPKNGPRQIEPVENSTTEIRLVIKDANLIECFGTRTGDTARFGPVPIDCEHFRRGLPGVLRTRPAELGQSFEVRMQTEQLVGEGYLSSSASSSGRIRLVMQIAVNASGKVTRCTPIEGYDVGGRFVEEECIKASPEYQPLPATASNQTDRVLTIVSTTSFSQ